MAALMAALKFYRFSELLPNYLIISMVSSGKPGRVTHDPFPESLKSYTTWLLLTSPKCRGLPCGTTLMATKNDPESKQFLAQNICGSHNFFTNYILFNCLGLEDWVFSIA